MILALRTDKPEAELYLLDAKNKQIDQLTWLAHRELSNTLLEHIETLLEKQQADLTKLTGIVVFQGPGSFTGLRIGITVANTLGYALGIPVAGGMGNEWQVNGQKKLVEVGQFNSVVMPEYGAEAHITKPRK